MSEFNGKKFYGFSLHNDPALTTSTRNFEFRYTRPEQLERAIQKVQLTDLANNAKQKKNIMYCKMKRNGRDNNTPYQSRDIDVETHVSRTDNKTRALSANEVDQLIGRAKSSVESIAPNALPLHQADRDAWYTGDELPVKYTQTQDDLQDLDFLQDGDRSDSEFVEFASILDCRVERPKWVEIQEEARGRAVQVDIKSVQRKEPQALCQAYTPGYVPGGMDLSSALSPNLNMMRDDDNPAAYFVEDSDLEYEMLGRADYAKYCHPRPREDEMVNVSNDSGGFPEFIELEPQIPCMDLSFLKNASPIRYTDLTDETQEERIENPQMKVYINERNKKVQPHSDKKIGDKETDKKCEKDATMSLLKKKKKPKYNSDKSPPVTTPRSKFTKLNDTPRSPRTPRSPCASPRLVTRTRSKPPITPRYALKENSAHRGSNHSNHSHQSHHSNRSHHSVVAGSGTDRSLRNIVLSKAIEDLKVEKIAIFTKMTATQERIIEIMDKLRLSLLELYVPENSYEKSKRQKNAFEFSVRFSRNFLYPLKGMIDDMRHTTVEQLNSASSNDACARVASIYALVLQSLQTYQKQLRFFMLDQVPQKLTTLIEMLNQVTTICLEKGLFDRNDAIIECVQERCTKFLGFLEDMHEERFLTARENYRKMNFDKPHANYDLKMFMNDLNMYEPKLVPKVQPYHRHKSARGSQRKLCKGSNSKMANALNAGSGSKLMLTKVAEDAIATQIESLEKGSSQGVVQGLFQASANDLTNKTSDTNDNPLNKIIMEALQKVTKDQVRQVLEPIIQTLGTALDKMNNSEVIEKLLNAFDMKFIPTPMTTTTQDETKKRCDADKYEKGGAAASAAGCKVVGAKVSASSIGKATKASKAAAQTEKLLQQHKQQHQQQPQKQQHECADEDDDENENDNDTEDEADGDDDIDDEEADNNSSNYKLKSSNNNNNNTKINNNNSSNQHNNSKNNRNNINLNLSTLVESKHKNNNNNVDDFDIGDEDDDDDDDDESSTASESETATEEEEEEDDSPESGRIGGGGDGGGVVLDDEANAHLAAANASMNAQMNTSVNAQQFDVLYVNKKHPQPLLAERKLGSTPPPPSPHTAPKQALQQQIQQQLQLQQQKMLAPLPPERLLFQPHKCTQGRKTTATLNQEKQRKLPRPQQQQQQQPLLTLGADVLSQRPSVAPKSSRLYKVKRRNLNPPPPVPTGTPTTSARSKKNEEVISVGGSHSSDTPPPPVTYVEKLHALTKQTRTLEEQQLEQKMQQAQAQTQVPTQPLSPKMTSAQHDSAMAYGNVLPVPLTNAFGLEKGGEKIMFLLQNRCVADALKQCEDTKREEELPKRRFTTAGGRSRSGGRSASSGRSRDCAASGDFNKSALSIHTSKSAYLRQQQQLLQHQQHTQKQQQQHLSQQQQQPPTSPQHKQHQWSSTNTAINKENIADTNPQQHDETADNNPSADIRVDQLLNERDQFLHLCGNNRFYANPNYAEPWKVFSRISDKLVNEIVNSVEEDFSIGVSRFVQDFLELETKS